MALQFSPTYKIALTPVCFHCYGDPPLSCCDSGRHFCCQCFQNDPPAWTGRCSVEQVTATVRKERPVFIFLNKRAAYSLIDTSLQCCLPMVFLTSSTTLVSSSTGAHSLRITRQRQCRSLSSTFLEVRRCLNYCTLKIVDLLR